MNIKEELNRRLKDGEKAIVFAPLEGDVKYSDFEPLDGSKAAQLRDVIDLKTEKDLMQFVSMTMRVPGTMAESECDFRGSKRRIRGIYLDDSDPHVFLFIK